MSPTKEKCLVVRVGREEEGVNSLRPEFAAVARTLQATPPEVDLLYLRDSETTLDRVSRWIGSGPRTTLAGDANADIMKTIIKCVRERVIRGARTFMVKVKAHRGEPLNERADTQPERARQLPPECQQWTTCTSRMLYAWQDKGVKRVSTWSKAVRRAMLKGGAEFQRQKVLNRAEGNWNKEFLQTTDTELARIRQVACTGGKSDLMDSTRWGWECMLQLREAEDRKDPAATTCAAEFLLRVGESWEFLGLWMNSVAIHEAKRRRATQVITCSFPCGEWLHMIGARASPRCELCRRERRHEQAAIEHLPAGRNSGTHSKCRV
jgi:ribonuclease HI